MRSSLGFSRQPALSPRQPRGGSGGERWRGGGQPQGCRSHHEPCLLCADSPALSGADPQNWPGRLDQPAGTLIAGRTVRPGKQAARTVSPHRHRSHVRKKAPMRAEKRRLQRPRTGAETRAGGQGFARKPLNARALFMAACKRRFCRGAWLRTQSGANRSPGRLHKTKGKMQRQSPEQGFSAFTRP